MDIPPLASTEGAYWYLISLLLGITLFFGLYIAAVELGVAPPPTRLVTLTPAAI